MLAITKVGEQFFSPESAGWENAKSIIETSSLSSSQATSHASGRCVSINRLFL